MIKQILFTLLSFLFVVTSCKIKKDTFILPQEEYDKFSLKGNEVLYEGNVVATFGVVEFEYFEGKLIREYSLVQYTSYSNELTEKILRYMHMRYPDHKIEIKFSVDKK